MLPRREGIGSLRGSMVRGHVGSGSWNEWLRTAVQRYGYGVILIGSLLVLWWGVEGPYPIEHVANALYVVMIFVILGLELWIPFTATWGDVRNATREDVIYFLLAAPIDALQVFLLVGLLAKTSAYHHYLRLFDVWPRNAPILLQLLLATLLVDFFKYWYHRWTHEVPLLWRMHSIHHSLNRLEMFRASYFYPMDILLTVGTGTLAMLMVGASYELIVFHNVYAGITGLLNHSNADLHCGFFDSILNSPGHHRAHHSVGLPGGQSNYGSFFNFTDRLFGTRYLPKDRRGFDALGLDESYRMPNTFLAQLAVPFRWRSIRSPA
jgi:sterol desaturase/sphingolipid hydroxylase (fatty acid hydroxylase superfamily)